MTSPAQASPALYLWPEGAPGARGARGATDEDRPRLTPYLPESSAPRAAVIVCPGGGYAMRAQHEGEPIAQWLNTLGLAAFVLDYRVAPYRFPRPQQDAQRAIRTVRHRAAEWKIDPNRIGILGFSAGGHLATSAATLFEDERIPRDANDPIDAHSPRPDALIACYAVISFGEFGHQGSANNLLGPDIDPQLRKDLSLETRVTAQTPPAFLWHTSDDAGVPVENSLHFAQAMHAHKRPFALHVYPVGRHGLGLASDDPHVSQWTRACADWLRSIEFTS